MIFFLILGGEFSKTFPKGGGEYFAQDSPSWGGGGAEIKKNSGGVDIPPNSAGLPMYAFTLKSGHNSPIIL